MKINLIKKIKGSWGLLLLVILFISSIFWYKGIANSYPFLNIEKMWQGESESQFEQYSVFFSSDNKINIDDIKNFREQVNTKFSQDIGYKEDEAKGKWIDCYFAKGKASVKSEHNSFSVQTVGVGGDYFFFNPMMLIKGSYISEDNVNKNLAVLDERAAWGLYGSTDIVGKSLTLDGRRFIVSGVIESQDNKTEDYTGTIYINYKTFNDIKSIDINNYQAILPKPIKDYGKNILNDNFPSQDKEIIKNTNRFKPINIMKKLFDVESYIVKDKAIAYPYFENVARVTEYQLIKALKVIIVLAILILVDVVFLIINNKLRIYLYFSNLKVVQYVEHKYKKYNKDL